MNGERSVLLGERPNPRQALFFGSRAKHTAYGGARGGGKSWAMRTKLVLLAARYDGIQILLMRRTLPELRENHIRPLQAALSGVAVWNEQRAEFLFPNGSRIRCGYCDSENEVTRYQGQAYDVIGLEEATLFTEYQRDFLTTCSRPSDAAHPVITPRMYYTCNPGGVGHAWVKRLFIDREYRGAERPEDYAFIPASVYDNAVLMRADPDYVRTLENLPEELKRAHLFGDWNALAGRFFTEFSPEKHVIPPFRVPPDWPRYRAIDYGLDCAVCVWAAFDEEGRCYVTREYAEKDRIISAAAGEILGRTPADERTLFTFAPTDLASRSRESGVSRFELFARNGLLLTPVRQGREDGWMNIRERLAAGPDGRPRLFVFDTCRELIRCLPLLTHDEKNPDDASTEPHGATHLPDALRYLLAGRPLPAKRAAAYPFAKNDGSAAREAFLRYGR